MPYPLLPLHRLLVAPVAALLLAAAPPAPAGAQEPPAETYFDRVEVEIANVEVFVTDAAGRPVTGLDRDDFALFVDGEPTEIRNFHAAAAAAVPAPPPVAGTAAGEAAPPSVGPPPEQNVTLVILVDDRHATPGERKRVLERLAAHFSRGLPPSTRAMVATLADGILVRQPLTADGTAVAAALEDLKRSSARGYGEIFELRAILGEIEEAATGLGAPPRGQATQGSGARGDVLFAVRNFEQRERSDLEYSLEQIARLIASLGGMPGHKALLYVGRGLNSAPGRALLAAAGGASELDLAASAAATVPGFQRLAELSNANRVSFYAVSTAAVGTSPLFGDVEAFTGSWSAAIEAIYRADLSTGLAVLADSTGGRSLAGGAEYDLIADWIAADAGHFYSLGFTPPPAPPRGAAGSTHRIEVRVPGRDVEVRHRRRLVTASREQRAAETTLAALLYGGGENPLAIAAEPGAPQPGERGMVVQPILVKVPFRALVLLPSGEGYDGEVSIHVATADAEGRYSEVNTMRAPVRVPAERLEAALAGVAGYRVALLVRPGPQKLAVAVRDVVGDVVSLLVLDLDVERPAGRAARGRGKR